MDARQRRKFTRAAARVGITVRLDGTAWGPLWRVYYRGDLLWHDTYRGRMPAIFVRRIYAIRWGLAWAADPNNTEAP